MKYIILTNDANNTIKTIFECIKNGEDKQGSKIESWKVEKATSGKEYIEHSPDQWVDKCYLNMIANKENDEVKIEFHYWKDSLEEERSETDDKIILGRFTELLLVHFNTLCDRIIIK